MTTTYDPKHPLYFDEADVREELTRVNLVESTIAHSSRPMPRTPFVSPYWMSAVVRSR